MANYYTDFADYDVGSVAGWTTRWTSRTYAIAADSGATGGKVLRASTAGGNARSLISWDAIDSDADRADCEVLIRSRSSANDTSAAALFCGPLGRGSAVGTNTGYVNASTQAPLGHTIGKYVSGSATFPPSFEQEWDANVFYWNRFRLHGTSRKAKRWSGNLGDEPDEWQIEDTDASISAAGWVGFFTFAGSGNNHDLDLIAVGTDGDAAVIPASGNIRRRQEESMMMASRSGL